MTRRLRRHGLMARVAVTHMSTSRYATDHYSQPLPYHSHQRTSTLLTPTNDPAAIAQVARESIGDAMRPGALYTVPA